MLDSIPDIADAGFCDTMSESDWLLVVEFYTENCLCCQRLEPLLEDAAADYPDARFVRMNAQANETRPKHELDGTPTLVVYRGGEEVVTKTGALRDQQLRAFLRAYLWLAKPCLRPCVDGVGWHCRRRAGSIRSIFVVAKSVVALARPTRALQW